MTTTRQPAAAAESIGGMLWFVELPPKGVVLDWPEEVTKAAEFYHAKYKRFPSVIRMNPKDRPADFRNLANMKIVDDPTIIHRHVLVSEEGKIK